MQTVHYNSCPICGGNKIHSVLACMDHTVSNQLFNIYECEDCTGRFTQDVPDENEIGAFYKAEAYVSHTETKKGLVNRLYHSVRSVTLRSKYKLLSKYTGKATGNLLDIGAGTGAFAETMRSAGWKVTGLEPDETARTNAKKNHNIELLPLNAIQSLPKNEFDAITLWHVLEHVHQLHKYFELFASLLKENGVLFIAVPNYTSDDAKRYGKNWAAYDVPRHLYHFSPKSMEVLTRQHGFNIVSMKPMWYDSFYVSMLSEQYKSGNNNLPSAVMSGLFSNWKAAADVRKCSSVIYIIKKA
jgi:2-polyprenyl-3-methyl-5-hydroxy-6-metoxy-1,4-benzoquinol methylase